MPTDSLIQINIRPDAILPFDAMDAGKEQRCTHMLIEPKKPIPQQTGFGNNPTDLLVMIFVFFLVFLLIKYARYKWLVDKVNAVFEEKRASYDDMLSIHNPYYRSLDRLSRDRFMKRLIFFIEAKEFEFVEMEGEEHMPVLISSAAIQITFGLKHYMLDYFTKIYVLKNEYRYGNHAQPFEGNVGEEGIYLSWSDFFREYGNYTDGENVGLHEMAHALTYVNFTVQEGRDDSFRNKFYAFSPVARPVFERMQKGESTLLDKYAATTYEEFWAVCIETFFERPVLFRDQLPDLYSSLCSLLNQDPTTKTKVLDPGLDA